MMGRKAAKSATVSEPRLARLKNSKTLAFEPVLAASGGLGALQLLDGVVQTPRRLETSTLRETISQKTQEGRESKLLRGPPHQTAQLIFGCETLRTQALFQAARIVSP